MDLLEKKIYSIVRKVINEERGISDEVYNAANEVLSLIRRDADMNMNDGNYASAFNGDAQVIRNEFSFDFAGEEISVVYNTYIFPSNDVYNSYKRMYPHQIMSATSQYKKDDAQIFVVYNYVEGNGYDDSICDRVQHELEHLYQEIKKGGTFPRSPLKKRVNVGLMRRKDKNVFIASFILYCARDYEQDAFANGLYNWLMNGNGDKNEIVRGSGIAKYRRMCLKYISELEKLPQEEKERVSDFLGISVDRVIKKGYNACTKMKNKANRVIYKYGEDTGNRVNFVR